MPEINTCRAEFVRSAASPHQFIRNSIPKLAFAGRSNVGKSSVINCLLNRKQFARVGAAPGKTIHVNYFLIDEKLYLIDLPGYGYAKVSQEERKRWADLMEAFFVDPGLYDCGVLIVDARHRPNEDDVKMANYFRNSQKSFLVLANKTDKLKKSEILMNTAQIRETLHLTEDEILLPFSAEKGEGRDQLLKQIRSM